MRYWDRFGWFLEIPCPPKHILGGSWHRRKYNTDKAFNSKIGGSLLVELGIEKPMLRDIPVDA